MFTSEASCIKSGPLSPKHSLTHYFSPSPLFTIIHLYPHCTPITMMPELTVLPPSQVDWTITHWRDPPTEEGTLYAQLRLVDPNGIYSEHYQEDQPGYSKVFALKALLDDMDLDITVERDAWEMRDMKDTINEVAGRQGGEAGDALVTQVAWADAFGALAVTVAERPLTATEKTPSRRSQASINKTAEALRRVLENRRQKQSCQTGAERGRRRRGGQNVPGNFRQHMWMHMYVYAKWQRPP
jgi:hypothetical protein